MNGDRFTRGAAHIDHFVRAINQALLDQGIEPPPYEFSGKGVDFDLMPQRHHQVSNIIQTLLEDRAILSYTKIVSKPFVFVAITRGNPLDCTATQYIG